MLTGLRARLRALIFRARYEAELNEEMQYHRDQEVARLIRAGMATQDAEAAVRRAFGRIPDYQDAVRAAWGFRWVDTLRQDVRFALRTFRRDPTLVGIVMITVGLGIAPLAAGFTLFNAYVLKPAPVFEPSSIYAVEWRTKAGRRGFTWERFGEFARLPAVSSAIAYRSLYTRSEGQSISGQLVSGNYFAMLGVRPALGRVLTTEDAVAAGVGNVAVLNHRYWVTHFGQDSAILGKSLSIRGIALTIVGVAAAGFDGLEDGATDYWCPVTIAPRLEGDANSLTADTKGMLTVVARFRSTLQPKAASAAVESWLRVMTASNPEPERVQSVELVPRATPNPLDADVLLALTPFAIAFGLVLLAACANIASLMVARGLARQREIGVRIALGAGRQRLVRQLVTESLLLALPAGLLGLVVTKGVVSGSLVLLNNTLPEAFRSQLRMAPLDSDVRVQLFVAAASVASALVFGLIPALQTTRTDLVRATRGEFSGEARPSRLRRTLVTGQVAVASLLVCLTSVMLVSSRRAANVSVGFGTKGLLAIRTTDRSTARVVERLRAYRDVRAVAAASVLPLTGGSRGVGIQRTERDTLKSAAALSVSPEFFTALGLELRAGRTFGIDEARGDAPVVIINQALADMLRAEKNSLDRPLLLTDPARVTGGAALAPRQVRIVGIAPNIITGWIGERGARPTVFLPMPIDAPGSRLLVNTRDASPEGQRALEEWVTTTDPGTIDNIYSMDDVLRVSAYPFRMGGWIGIALGALALALSLTGVFGMMAFTVARRSREFGVRMALGATARTIASLVLRETTRIAAWGIALGLAVAFAVAAVAGAVVEQVRIDEPLVWLTGTSAVLLGCVLGAAIPSYRAARTDPNNAIRSE